MRSLKVVLMLTLVVGGGCTKELPDTPRADDLTEKQGALGTPVDYFGIVVTVREIAATTQSTAGFPRLQVTMQSTSKLSASWTNPDVVIRCGKTSTRGEWHRGSSWEPNAVLPGGAQAEGQVIVGFPPKDSAKEYPLATCPDARLEVTGTDPSRRERRVVTSYPVPDELIAQAVNSPREAR